MAACAVELGRPEVAEDILAAASDAGTLTPAMRITAGRAALVRGDATRALGIARAISADTASDHDLKLSALDLEGRAHDFLGDRDAARATWERQAARRLPRGAHKRSSVLSSSWARSSCSRGNPRIDSTKPLTSRARPEHWSSSAGRRRTSQSRSGYKETYPLRGPSWATRLPPAAALRLDQLAYLLASFAATSSYVTNEGIEETLAEAEALMDTTDLRLHTSSIRADIAFRARRYDDALAWLDASREILRTLPGAVPVDSLCWRVWALAAMGRPVEARVALEEARQMPDLERWYGRSVVLAAGEALLDRDEEGIDRALGAAPGSMPLDIALMRLLAAELLAGESAVRWLREALDLYENGGATLDADRVRRALRDAGGPVPRRRRAQAPVPDELATAGVTSRESDVLRLLGDGLPNAEIAARLYVSVRTVEAHVSSLLAKLGARNRAQLATVATRSFG